MTATAQVRELRRARKLRALRLISSRTATVPSGERAPMSPDEVRALWLHWGGFDAPHTVGRERRSSAVV
jgi:hypothetical protein